MNGKELDEWEDALMKNMKRKRNLKIFGCLISIMLIVCVIMYEKTVIYPKKNENNKEREKERERRRVYIYNYYKLDIIIKFIFIKLLNINYY